MDKDFINQLIKKSDLTKTEYFLYNENRIPPSKIKNCFKYKKFLKPIFKDYVTLSFKSINNLKTNYILEIGAIKVLENNINETFLTFVNPNVIIPPFISNKTNITNDIVKNYPKIEEILPKFINFIEDYPIIIHNKSSNINLILSNCENHNIKFQNPILDITSTTKFIFPHLKKYDFNFLCKNFNIINLKENTTINKALSIHYLYEILYKKYS